jgi:hypothetical protein
VTGLRGRGALALTAVLVIGAALATSEVGEATAAPRPDKEVHRVLVFSAPFVSWADLRSENLPNFQRLIDRSAVANLTTRTIGPRSLAGGYATLGAGTRATGGGDPTDGEGLEAGETFGTRTAQSVFRERTELNVDSGIVQLGIERMLEANDAERVDAKPGRLGSALARGGFARAVVANADGNDPTFDLPPYRRYAVAALMDTHGVLPEGRVDDGLLAADPAAPFGVVTDADAAVDAFRESFARQSVVLVEASDLARAAAYRDVTDPTQGRLLFREALERSDALLGSLLEHVDLARDAVILVDPVRTFSGTTMTPIAISAPGFDRGLLRSASTRRTGYVLLADVAPTVLHLVGVKRPVKMSGRPMTVARRSISPGTRVGKLDRAVDAAQFRDRVRGPVTIVFALLEAVLAASAAFVILRRPGGRARGAVHLLALATLGFVPAVFLARLVPFHRFGVPAYWLFLFAVSIAFACACRTVGRRRRDVDPVIVALSATVALLLVDVLVGARLQLSSAFGYSATIGVRIAGFGNVSYAVLGASAILLAVLLAHRFGARGVTAGVVVLGATLVADVAPFWGSDVGGALSLIPAFAVVAAQLEGWRVRLTARTAVILGGLTAMGVAAAIVVDLARPENQRTHLGRLVERISEEGWKPFGDVIVRKLDQNVATLSNSDWRPLLLIGLIALLFLFRTHTRPVSGLVDRIPELRTGLVGFSILAVLGYALNDSGVAIPAVMLGVLLPVLIALLLARDPHAAPLPDTNRAGTNRASARELATSTGAPSA